MTALHYSTLQYINFCSIYVFWTNFGHGPPIVLMFIHHITSPHQRPAICYGWHSGTVFLTTSHRLHRYQCSVTSCRWTYDTTYDTVQYYLTSTSLVYHTEWTKNVKAVKFWYNQDMLFDYKVDLIGIGNRSPSNMDDKHCSIIVHMYIVFCYLIGTEASTAGESTLDLCYASPKEIPEWQHPHRASGNRRNLQCEDDSILRANVTRDMGSPCLSAVGASVWGSALLVVSFSVLVRMEVYTIWTPRKIYESKL